MLMMAARLNKHFFIYPISFSQCAQISNVSHCPFPIPDSLEKQHSFIIHLSRYCLKMQASFVKTIYCAILPCAKRTDLEPERNCHMQGSTPAMDIPSRQFGSFCHNIYIPAS